jgi:hypothetical protein
MGVQPVKAVLLTIIAVIAIVSDHLNRRGQVSVSTMAQAEPAMQANQITPSISISVVTMRAETGATIRSRRNG